MDAAVEARVEPLRPTPAWSTPPATAAPCGSAPSRSRLFREYMAMFCREQAYCHLSPALVQNLERHWL